MIRMKEIVGRTGYQGHGYTEGAITLLPTVEKDGNPSARLGLDPRKFRVERTLMHIRLISLGSDGGLSLRK